MIKKIRDYLTTGDTRSIVAKKNILGSIIIKGLSIVLSLVMVPLTIHYINPVKYGIWITMSSMVAWMSFFDIGFTQGLRNRFAEAKAQGKIHLARTYISTSYFFISIIFITIWAILLIVNQYLDWGKLLNIDPSTASEVSLLAIIIITYFCFQFIFRIITTLLTADQQPAKASLLDLIGQFVSLIIIFGLTKLTSGSLLYLGLALGIAPTLVLIGANFFFFKTVYKDFAPSFQFIKIKYANDILTLGLKFFVLQIASVVQYQTTIFLIAHYFEPLQVTYYNIAFKYFGVLQMAFMILVTPLWSGTTDAYNSGDVDWIRNTVRKYLYILIPFVALGTLMLAVADPLYTLWLGKDMVDIPFNISVLCYLFFITGMFASIFVFVINGIGALQIQFYSSIITSIGFIALALLLIKQYHLGIESILISSIIANVFGFVIAPIQYYNIIIKKSRVSLWYR